MPNLLTQCPFCQTSFKVSDEQMQAANGVVRCGSCMEVFLAKQHRIILKDRAGDESPADSPDFIEEPALEAESPAEHTETELDPIEDSLPSMFEEETGEESFLDDTIEDEQADEQFEEHIEEQIEELDEDPDEVPDESPEPSSEYSFEDEPAEEDEESSNNEDDVLVFGPWDDQDVAEEALESAEVEIAEFEDTDEDSTEQEPEEILLEEEDDDQVAEFDSEEIPEQESESDTPWTPLPPREGFSKSLNPGGYSMQKFSVDHILPSLSSKDQESQSNEEPEAEETQAEVQTQEPVVGAEEPLQVESPAARPAETPRVFNDLHSGLHKSIRKLNQLEPDDTPFDGMEDEQKDETDESAEGAADIPVLSPDVVASENIPTGMSGESMAWLQSVPGPTHAEEDSGLSEDYTGADDKAQIMSHLSALEDEESLAPLEPEHLDAIDEEPVELHSVTDPLRHWKTAARLLTCLILLVGLAGQYVMYNLDALLIDRRYDSITNLICQLTECPDNQVIDLTSLVTEELDVRSHPAAENALLVNFIFRNDAPREQRFPLVELNFTDISGDVVANRVFTREEYLPSEMALFTHMPAHSSIQVSLELVDPGNEATGYSLVFRNP